MITVGSTFFPPITFHDNGTVYSTQIMDSVTRPEVYFVLLSSNNTIKDSSLLSPWNLKSLKSTCIVVCMASWIGIYRSNPPIVNLRSFCLLDQYEYASNGSCTRSLIQFQHLAPSLFSHLPLASVFHNPNKISFPYPARRSSVVLSSHRATEEKPISGDRMLVFVPPHPLIKHWVTVLRNEQTPCPVFRNAMAELGRFLIYEASRDWLPTLTGEIQSPMGAASVEFIDPREPVSVIPVLRAGLALAEHASSVLPATKTYHLGISRDKETLQPSVYLNKLPQKFPEGTRIILVDPMLATGGTIVEALNLLKERGAETKQIKVISAVSASPALQKLSEQFPGLHVYTGIIDPIVNEKGFIIPGLGNAGDRSFGT